MTRAQDIAFPNRTFQLWLFKPGHRQLLLRSPGDPDRQVSQIDILFKNVTYLALNSVLGELVIREGDETEQAKLFSARQTLAHDGSSHIFILRGEGSEGLVVAGHSQHVEYEGDFRQESPLVV